MTISKEKKAEYMKKYYAEHKEQVNACSTRCHKANPELRKEAQKRYYEKNKERLKEYQREYYNKKKEFIENVK